MLLDRVGRGPPSACLPLLTPAVASPCAPAILALLPQAAENPEQFYEYDFGEQQQEDEDDSDADPDYGGGDRPKKGASRLGVWGVCCEARLAGSSGKQRL